MRWRVRIRRRGEGATRLALVTLEQMTQTLAWAVENPPERLQIFEPPQIKLGGGCENRLTVPRVPLASSLTNLLPLSWLGDPIHPASIAWFANRSASRFFSRST